jgi:hypothetical protein
VLHEITPWQIEERRLTPVSFSYAVSADAYIEGEGFDADLPV